MKKIHVKRTFDFADEGEESREYSRGQEYDVSEECAQVAIQECWAVLVEAS